MFGFGRTPKKKRPVDTPFAHEDNCRTPDADPEWIDEGFGRWSRTCSCTVEHCMSTEPKPVSTVDVARHTHVSGCAGPAVVKEDPQTHEEYTRCGLCETSTHYFDISGMDAQSLAGLVR